MLRRVHLVTLVWALLLGAVRPAPAADAPTLGDDPTTFDRQIDAAHLKHDVAFLGAVVADDSQFTHGKGQVTNKQQLLDAARGGGMVARNVDAVQVERHGDVVATVGHIQVKTNNAQNPEYQVYYVRLYARRTGGWQLLSHRSVKEVDGPVPSP